MSSAVISTSKGGSAVSLPHTFELTQPSGRGFQTALYLKFSVDDDGDGVFIDAASTSFKAAFSPHVYNALQSPPIKAATLEHKNGATLVTLDGPRELKAVQLKQAGNVELHRADGSVPADKKADQGGFADVHFAIMKAGGGDIQPNEIKAIDVVGYPRNIRMGIAGTASDAPAMFWPTPDMIGKVNIDASSALSKALQANLTAQWSEAVKASQQKPPVALPHEISAVLVIQSDEPCEVKLTAAAIAYHQALTSFAPHVGEKQVLRYAGKSVERQSVSLLLPPSATVNTGTIRVTESLRSESLSARGDLVISQQITQTVGLRLDASDAVSAGQQMKISSAASLTGVALGLVALTAGAEVTLNVQTDWQGQPSGKTLASCVASLSELGKAQWTIFTLKDPIALPEGPCWLVAKASKGAAVWLAESGETGFALLDFEGGAWNRVAGLEGYEALYRLLEPTATDTADEASATPPVELEIGATRVSGSKQDDGSRLFDIAAAASAVLAGVRAQKNPPARTEVALEFVSAAAGQIFVYPPEVTYS